MTATEALSTGSKEVGCPTCAGPLPAATFGRPPVYCTIACRREMASLRRDLSRLEDERANALTLATNEFWPGRTHWHQEAARLERATADVRSRVREAKR